MGALAREGSVTLAGGPGPSANAQASTVHAIAFPDPGTTPAFPAPPGPADGDGPTPPPPSGGVPGRDRLIGAAVVLALVAILAGTIVWRVGRDDTQSATGFTTPTTEAPGSTTPSTTVDGWPAEVLPLVRFVEKTRGAPFDEPVPIQFLPRDEYEAKAQGTDSDMTDEDRQDLAMYEGQLKALGLADSTLDLDASSDQLAGSGTLAYYDPDENEINVLGTDLDVAHRVTLVHELTHAWQDQQGYLDQLDDLDDGQAATLHALAEGDAMRVEDAYIDTLSSSEQDDYDSQSAQQSEEADLSGIPESLLAAFSSPYVLGGPYAKLLDAEGGNAMVDEALADPPPADADIVTFQRWFDDVKPVDVAAPSIPAGAEQLDEFTFGSVSWLMTLGERVDPREALQVSDAWAGDWSVIYRQDGRICTAAAYQGDTPTATDLAARVIGEWASAMPAGYGATVERTGDVAVLRSCEPASGGEADVVGRTQTALLYPALRTEIAYEIVDGGGTIEDAVCFSNAVIDQLTVEDMESAAYNDPTTVSRLSATARRACPGTA